MESSKRQARLERRRSEQRQNQIKMVGYIAIAAVVVTGLLILAQQVSSPRTISYSQDGVSLKDGMSLGSVDAPVEMIEFLDFQCSHCRNSYNQTETPLIDQYVRSGQLRITYQVVGYLGEGSIASAEAAYCAADQNYFWEYHDILFAPSNLNAYSENRLIEYAGQIAGMDANAFSACLASDAKLATIQEAEALASSYGISGTPAFVINGTVLAGEQPLARFQELIDAALAAAGN